MNPENKCSHLFSQDTSMFDSGPLGQMFKMQKLLQDSLSEKGKGINIDKACFVEKVNQISMEWKNISLEMAELLERLPHKSWKSYTDEQLTGFLSEEDKLETWYEYIDMFHFFLNIGLLLGITSEDFIKLYFTKNKENFDRQGRGY